MAKLVKVFSISILRLIVIILPLFLLILTFSGPKFYFLQSDKDDELGSILVRNEKKIANTVFIKELNYRDSLMKKYKENLEGFTALMKYDSAPGLKINQAILIKNSLPEYKYSFYVPINDVKVSTFLVKYSGIEYTFSIDKTRVENILDKQKVDVYDFINVLKYQDYLSVTKKLDKSINITNLIILIGLYVILVSVFLNYRKRKSLRVKEKSERYNELYLDALRKKIHKIKNDNTSQTEDKVSHLIHEFKSFEKKYSIDNILRKNVVDSRDQSRELHSRAYLMLTSGLVLASIGVAVFYFTIPSPEELNSNTNNFLRVIIRPSLILLFIESIAWYLLRQYRLLIEDFKYFHKIYQKKVNYLTSYKILSEINEDPKSAQIMTAIFILKEEINDKIKPGETTDKIEAEKLNSETPFFNLIDKIFSSITSK